MKSTTVLAAAILLASAAFSWAQFGDFDGNGVWDCTDIDSLSLEIVSGANDVAFDRNADGLVDAVDGSEWLALAGAQNLISGQPFLPGDANLDGFVDGSDRMIWNANNFTSQTSWCNGDFNFDRVTDVRDYNIWNENVFTASGPLINDDPGPQPLDDAVDFIYDASTGVMSIDSNSLEIWCFTVSGVEPEEFLLNGGGDVNLDESIWYQESFLGRSMWFSLDGTSVGDDAIAIFATGLTADDFDYVSFGTQGNLNGRGSVTIVNAPVTVPEPSTVVWMLPVFAACVVIGRRNRKKRLERTI